MFGDSVFGLAAGASFGTLLLLAAAWDVRVRRIPNGLVACAALLGVAFAMTRSGVGAGLASALAGVALGLLIWLPCWLLEMVGAGDVKLFAAGAAWLGPELALRASLYAALAGGVLALAWLARDRMREAARSAGSAKKEAERREMRREARYAATLPYGVAMAIGLGIGAWLPRALG